MTDFNDSQNKKKSKASCYWILALLLSFFAHVALLYRLGLIKNIDSLRTALPEGYVKLNLQDLNPSKKQEPLKIEDEKDKRLLETPLLPNEKPIDADFLSQNDHKAKKLMKLKKRERDKAADPGQSKPKAPALTKKTTPALQKKAGDLAKMPTPMESGFGKPRNEGENGYEKLLASSSEMIEKNEMHEGYVDYLDDLIEEGETLDLNTQEYRFIGYFTGLRKAIELVWTYPSEAAHRGLHGQVLVKFVIAANGSVPKVQVLQSSGYAVLDQAIVDAIRVASPFAPLPKGFQKDHLVVKGAFSYVLGNY